KKYIVSEEESEYVLSPKDQMYGFEEIQKLKEIGIDSIKLEGRMKEPNYVYQTVSYYKELISGIDIKEESSTLFNRGFGTGYFYENENIKDEIMNNKYSSNFGKELGILKGRELKLKEKVILGDGVIFVSKDYEKLGGSYINKIDTVLEKNKKFANIDETILIKETPKGTKYVYRNFAKELSDSIENKLKTTDQKHLIEFSFKGIVGEKAKVVVETLNNHGIKIYAEIESENILELAKNKGVSKEIIKEKLIEIGDTTFYGQIKSIEISEGLFLPMSLLKQLKRDVVNLLGDNLIESYRRENKKEISVIERKEVEETGSILSAIVCNKEQEDKVREMGIKKIYYRGIDVAREGNLKNINLDSNLASNLYQVLENKNDKITLGWNLNVSNRYAFEYFTQLENVDTIILSPEVSYRRLDEIGETKIKKAILAYGKPRAMYTELPLFEEEKRTIENEQGDRFIVMKNESNNSEIYFERPLNILEDRLVLEKLGISELVLEFTTESLLQIEKVIEGKGEYKSYNYERGVF
ncbi:U32 family peptidase, partial [uncultured Cetobacterium sp.]